MSVYEPNDSEFGHTCSDFLERGPLALEPISDVMLDEFEQIARQILDTPAYADDSMIVRFAAAVIAALAER